MGPRRRRDAMKWGGNGAIAFLYGAISLSGKVAAESEPPSRDAVGDINAPAVEAGDLFLA